MKIETIFSFSLLFEKKPYCLLFYQGNYSTQTMELDSKEEVITVRNN